MKTQGMLNNLNYSRAQTWIIPWQYEVADEYIYGRMLANGTNVRVLKWTSDEKTWVPRPWSSARRIVSMSLLLSQKTMLPQLQYVDMACLDESTSQDVLEMCSEYCVKLQRLTVSPKQVQDYVKKMKETKTMRGSIREMTVSNDVLPAHRYQRQYGLESRRQLFLLMDTHTLSRMGIGHHLQVLEFKRVRFNFVGTCEAIYSTMKQLTRLKLLWCVVEEHISKNRTLKDTLQFISSKPIFTDSLSIPFFFKKKNKKINK
ncbi:hypothetical protein RFI_25464 [Reticulomyxa filosa]|uniref:Uncharacterized protein n=1 Tax=Reticulomyxa filosa TaxID=46433 RepID=X6MFW4_RETFI|nr:hypothetical protein RFI_25464 [Reticulomyxa filosa]|eukprot:ETO11915.1 hypothetical protein RFI_25464 [Reticulomyxa filosa]